MTSTLRSALLILALAPAIAVAPARAAGAEGGQTTVVDGHPITFAATDAGVAFLLHEEDGKPIDTAGLSAKAFVQAGAKTETLALRPAPPNRLVADLKAPLPRGTKVVLSVRLHGHAIQARFAAP